MPNDARDRDGPGLALKIGIAGALAIGALASGYLASRQGRRVLREAFQGRRRTRLEDRVLDALWGDREVGSRALDVSEVEAGVIAISGKVRSEDERKRVLDIVSKVKDVREMEDRLVVETRSRRRPRFLARR